MKKSECQGCFFLASLKTVSICMASICEPIDQVEDCKVKLPIKDIKRVVLKKTHGNFDPLTVNRFRVYTEEGVEITSILSTKDIKCVVIVMDENLNVEQSFFLTEKNHMKQGDAGRLLLFHSEKCHIGYLEK